MSNPTSWKPGLGTPPESDVRAAEAQALKAVEATRALLTRARAEAQAFKERVDELKAVCRTLEDVARGLSDATFRAASAATRGASATRELVSFVEELGSLAKTTARASYEMKAKLGPEPGRIPVTDASFADGSAAQEQLARLVRQLADRAAQPRAPSIQVEVRSSRASAASASAKALDDEADDLGWRLGAARSSGYKN
ncbi:MAG: hypothetical protein KA712_19865 [Myxococcales bacterium]|nr:hypothetical protein [Myxococcales bacterium]